MADSSPHCRAAETRAQQDQSHAVASLPSHTSLRPLQSTGVLFYHISPNLSTKGQVLRQLLMSASAQEAIGVAVWHEDRTTPAELGQEALGAASLQGMSHLQKHGRLRSLPLLCPGEGVQDAQEGANSTSLEQSIICCRENGPWVQQHSVKMPFAFAPWGFMRPPA